MVWVRFTLGVLVLLAGVVVLGLLDAREWQFPLFLLALAPFLLTGGLLMGLDQEPPPWRRRARR